MPGRHPIPEREPAPVSLGPCPRVLVIKLATLGDLLLALPSLRALRTRYPGARLDLLTTTASAPLIADSPLVDRVYTLDLDVGRGMLHPGTLVRSAATLAQLRANHYDAALLLHHLTLPAGRRKHRALLASIAPRITAGLDNGYGGFLGLRVPDGGFGARHEAEYALAVAWAVGAAELVPHECGPRLADLGWGEREAERGTAEGAEDAEDAEGREREAEQTRRPRSKREGREGQSGVTAEGTESDVEGPSYLAWAHGWGSRARCSRADYPRSFRPPAAPTTTAALDVVSPPGPLSPEGEEEAGASLVALHPGGGAYSLARRWPAAHYAELAAALHAETDARIAAIAGPGEEELADEVVAALGSPDWARVESPATPRDLAALLVRCALLIGNDTFPMHLATAAGIPVVAIFGPSNAQAWGPYAPAEPERVAVVRRDELPCSPCFYRGHALGLREGCPPRMCLTNLPVERVLAAARRLLRAWLDHDITEGLSASYGVPRDPAGV